jgi:cytochrome b pre-mRNA-processing protein 3
MILTAFRRRRQDRTIQALYGAIVAQGRSVDFYARYGVPDTVEGRFELIVLHLVLLLARLGGDQTPGRGGSLQGEIAQPLFDVFCRDLDDNLREMAVGDMAVPRRMRAFGEAFYGRKAAYTAALGEADNAALENALARNIFGVAAADDRAVRLARYARAAAIGLSAMPEDALLAAGRAAEQIMFPRPESFADA